MTGFRAAVLLAGMSLVLLAGGHIEAAAFLSAAAIATAVFTEDDAHRDARRRNSRRSLR